MKKQLISITLFFMIAATIVFFVFNLKTPHNSYKDSYQEQLVDLNEIEQLTRKNDIESQKKVEHSISEFKNSLTNSQANESESNEKDALLILYGFSIVFLFLVFSYVYLKIIRPFDKLKNYAGEIANGNFNTTLQYERTNFFGAFTWAFDHMRREIIKSRACEKEAINNNKTVIATLSHDIKTPIASIRAYAEGLDANLDSSPEKRRRYISVIMQKCDEVTRLTNDLFFHSLSDLDKLQISPLKENINNLLEKILHEMQIINSKIVLAGNTPDVFVMIDTKRFEQVLENLINNAEKYASGSRIEISSEIEGDEIFIHVQDYGNGIPYEDIPFIFDKFYRGRNVGDNQGSGMGLYIVKYLIEQMNGNVSLTNTSKGLMVTLSLPYIS